VLASKKEPDVLVPSHHNHSLNRFLDRNNAVRRINTQSENKGSFVFFDSLDDFGNILFFPWLHHLLHKGESDLFSIRTERNSNSEFCRK